MSKEEKKERFITIREYFEGFLDNNKCQIFKFAYNGSLYAANPKTKKPCRISISLPKTIVDTNLKDLDKWVIVGVAVPREEIRKENEEKDIKKTKETNKKA